MRKAAVIPLLIALSVPLLAGASGCSQVFGNGHNPGAGATRVTFVVTGSARHGAHITYTDGPLVYRGPLPMHVTEKIGGSRRSEVVSAQLRGGGHITCKVIIGKVVKVGHASGGHHFCIAELSIIGSGWH